MSLPIIVLEPERNFQSRFDSIELLFLTVIEAKEDSKPEVTDITRQITYKARKYVIPYFLFKLAARCYHEDDSIGSDSRILGPNLDSNLFVLLWVSV